MERTRPTLTLNRTTHPLGYDCEKCQHVVKDPQPGSAAMKCCRYPPTPQVTIDQRTGGVAFMSIQPPVQPGEWCGEYAPTRMGGDS